MEIKFNGTPGEVIMEVEDFLELKSHKNDLTPEAAQAVTKVVIDTVKKEAKAKLEKQAAKAPKKEEPKPEEADMKPTPEPAPKKEEKTLPADLRTMCANYCHKVPDGKQRIKEWLDGKGYKKVSEIPDADLPEFKALVNI